MGRPAIRYEIQRKLEEALRADWTLARSLRAAPIQTLRTLGSLSAEEVRELGDQDVAGAVEAMGPEARPARYVAVRRALMDALRPLLMDAASGPCAPCAEGAVSAVVPADATTAMKVAPADVAAALKVVPADVAAALKVVPADVAAALKVVPADVTAALKVVPADAAAALRVVPTDVAMGINADAAMARAAPAGAMATTAQPLASVDEALSPAVPTLETTLAQPSAVADAVPPPERCSTASAVRVRAKALQQLVDDLERDRNLVLHLEAAPGQGLAQLSYLDARERGELLKYVEAADLGGQKLVPRWSRANPTEWLTTSSEQPDRGVCLLCYTIPPGLHTPIAVKMPPHAVCVLRPDGDRDDQRAITLVAAFDGTVVFHARPSRNATGVMRFVVSTELAGDLDKVYIHLRPGFHPAAGWPSPPVPPRVPRDPRARVLPAVSEEQQMCLSSQELLRRGYPSRPDPKMAPNAFSAWAHAVSRPMTRLPNSRRSSPLEPPLRAGFQERTNENWGGFQLLGSPNTYNGVTGTWTVPPVSATELNKRMALSMWVGFDGSPGSQTNLTQAGLDAQAIELAVPVPPLGPSPGTFAISAYWPMVQIWKGNSAGKLTPVPGGFWPPNEGNLEQLLVPEPNWPVYPLDVMSVSLGVNNISAGSLVSFTVVNYSALWIFTEFVQLPAGFVTGGLVEWILERPGTIGPNQLPLANYLVASITNAFAFKTSAGEVGFSSGLPQKHSYRYTLVGQKSNALSQVNEFTSSSMVFNWVQSS